MQQRDLLRRFTSHDVAPGTVVINEGEEGRGLFVVLSGELDVSRRARDGSAVPLGGLKTGDVFGEMSILRNARTAATVVAQRPATVLFLAREYVDRMVAGVPEIKSYLEALAEDREIDNQLAARRGRNSVRRANPDLGLILVVMDDEQQAAKRSSSFGRLVWLLVIAAIVFIWWYFREPTSTKVDQIKATDAEAQLATDPR